MEELTILTCVEELSIKHNGLYRPVYEDSSAALAESLTFLESWFGIVTHNTSSSLSIRKATVPVSIPRMKSLIKFSYVPKWYVAINLVVTLMRLRYHLSLSYPLPQTALWSDSVPGLTFAGPIYSVDHPW